MSDAWDQSASAWITEMGTHGDFGRRYVLDPVMRQRIEGRGFVMALDVGCGEGRFCRIMAEHGIRTVGVDPTVALVREARIRDPDGEYLVGRAEDLPFEDGRFDLVVSCLSLIDIPDIVRAISEMNRVLRPGGTLLIANLTGFTSACESGWVRRDGKAVHFPVDNYLEERWSWVSWRGIRIRNWHRPLSTYMAQFLQHGLTLGYFDEPAPVAGDPAKADRYRRVPYYVVMEWKKASAAIVP